MDVSMNMLVIKSFEIKFVYIVVAKMSDAGASQKGAPGSTPRLPFRIYLPLEDLVQEDRPRNIPPPPRDGNHRRRKELSGREILPGKFPPGEGKSSPSSLSSRWTSSGSSSPSSTTPSPSPPSTPPSSCCNIYGCNSSSSLGRLSRC